MFVRLLDKWCDVLQLWFSTENKILNIKSKICNKKERTWNLRLITDFYLHFLSSRFNLKQFSPDFCCYTDVKQARHSMIEGTSSNLLFFLKCHFLFGLSYWNIKYERASFQDGQRRAACCAPQKSGKGFAEAYSDIIHGPGRSSCTVWGPAVVCWNSAPDISLEKIKTDQHWPHNLKWRGPTLF